MVEDVIFFFVISKLISFNSDDVSFSTNMTEKKMVEDDIIFSSSYQGLHLTIQKYGRDYHICIHMWFNRPPGEPPQ